MSSYTLLEMVQTILSKMDSDEVSNYNDTTESTQVAHIIKSVWNDINNRADLPEHYQLFELTASGDNTKPTLMTKPSDVNSIEWIEYNKLITGETNPLFQPVKFIPLDEFFKMQDSLLVSDTTVGSWDETLDASDSITFIFRNDKAPDYYTTWNDTTLIFDSYDSAVDTTLQKTKTRAYGKKDKTFTLANATVPFADREMNTLLLNEATIMAFAELKQMQHPVAERWASRNWTKLNKSKRGIDRNRRELDRAPNYGRN